MAKKKQKEVVKDNWTLSIGFYPGVLFGIRTYDEYPRVTKRYIPSYLYEFED